MSIGRWINKEVVIHIHNGILLSYKEEHIWVSSNEVDETGACYTEWSKSERQRQILYINAYLWNLEKTVLMILYAGQQKRHKEQNFGLSGRRWGWDYLREYHLNLYITICKIGDQCKFNAWSRALKAGVLGQPRGMGLEGRWRAVQDRGTHVHPWLIHVNVWQKSQQYVFEVISLQLK